MDQTILERPPHGITKRLNAEKAARPPKLAVAEEDAALWLEGTAHKVYVLDDLARRFHRTPFDYITMYEVISSVRSSIKRKLGEALARLPKKHPAADYITTAGATLDTMHKTVVAFYDGEEPTLPLKTIGEVMRGFVVKAAQAIEHAELACGKSITTTGYLESPDSDPCRVPRKKK
jgi:hypothetical protein